jgi:hypothetical protein
MKGGGILSNFPSREILAASLPYIAEGMILRIVVPGALAGAGLIVMLATALVVSGVSLFNLIAASMCISMGYIIGKNVISRNKLVGYSIAGALLQVIIATSTWYLLKGDGATLRVFISSLYSVISGTGFLFLSLYIAEEGFRITTDLKLSELCNETHPVMRELREKAPGTFYHSLNVAFIAEEGARAIGVNNILCRAGGFYHDIGKIWKPDYYGENQYDVENVHENVSKDISRVIIISHIDEGIKIARRYRLGLEVESISGLIMGVLPCITTTIA